jgi:branched-chain amino acid transport system substrate-binding protein
MSKHISFTLKSAFKWTIFLSFLIIIAYVLVGCSQDEVTPENTTLIQPQAPMQFSTEPVYIYISNKPYTSILPDQAIKIGLLVEAGLDLNPIYGAELAMAEINREGGILKSTIIPPDDQGEAIITGVLDTPIALVIRDTKDDPAITEKQTMDLIIKDKVVAIIGPGYSRNAISASKVAQNYGVPMVATTATSPDVTSAGDYVFLGAFTDTFQGKVMASFARESLKARTAALLIQKGDPYTEGLSKQFEDDFTALGGNIVAREFYFAGDTDFKAQLTAIAKQAPDVVFMPGFTPEVPLAIKQARTIPQKNAAGITATFLGGDGWEETELVPLGGDALEGSYFSILFSPDVADGKVKDFVDNYQSMFGMDPDSGSAMGYDALKLVVTAIRRAGSVDKKAIRDQIAATSGYKGATYIQNYDENRYPIKSAVIMVIKNGKFVLHQQVQP